MKKLYTPPLFVILILSVMMLCLSCDPNNTPKTFTVTYDANGGKGTLEPARKTAKEAIVIANADSLSREGFTFSDWNTRKDGKGTSYAPGDKYEEDENLTLYAQWKVVSLTTTYTISYELGDGKLKDGETNPTVYTSETETFTLKNPIHESREFLGWKSKGDDDSTANTNVTIGKGSSGNLSFVAVWSDLGPFSFEYDDEKNCYAVKCVDKTITSCVIPSEYNGIPVKIIRGFGFNDCTQLSSITIPESITTIGNWAFQSCSSLTTITLPNGVNEIFAEAFGSCSNLESIYLPRSLKTIGRNIFPYCHKLKNIYYEGSRAEWNQININEEWDLLIRKNNYTIHYNSTM